MSAPKQVRGTCTECHTQGRFTPTEVMLRRGGAWHWRNQLLCAVCRVHLEQLAGATGRGTSLSRRPSSSVGAIAARSTKWPDR